VSTERSRASESELAKGDAASAKDLAGQAITAEPWAATPYAVRALALERLGDIAAAKRDVQRAFDREPENWRHPLLLARLDAEQGDRAGVESELREVRRLAPRSPYLLPTSPFRQQLDQLLAKAKGAT
jgi:tetratricopeptide (TPR) repeat protein